MVAIATISVPNASETLLRSTEVMRRQIFHAQNVPIQLARWLAVSVVEMRKSFPARFVLLLEVRARLALEKTPPDRDIVLHARMEGETVASIAFGFLRRHQRFRLKAQVQIVMKTQG
jgi:hypothetical protein